MKKFFQKKWVMVTEAVLLIVGAAGLTVSGVSSDGVQKIASIAVAGVSALDAIVTAVTALFIRE